MTDSATAYARSNIMIDSNKQKRADIQRMYREKNRAKVNEWQRNYLRNNPEKAKCYRDKRRDKRRAESIKWNRENPDKVKAAAVRWRELNPDKYKARMAAIASSDDHKRRHLEYYSGWELATKRCTRWDDVDDCIITERLIPDAVIARAIGRSVRAIEHRRSVLARINNSTT